MTTIQVFDPPMCCSTGVCGPSVDPKLIRFAADLEWLQDQGVDVERYNLSQQPGAFARTRAVKTSLAEEGNACLPLIVVDGSVVSKGRYPSREELAGLARLASGQVSQASAAPRCCCGPAPRRGGAGSTKRGNGCC